MPDARDIADLLKAVNAVRDRRSALELFGEDRPSDEVFETLVAERAENGPFTSLENIRERIGELAETITRFEERLTPVERVGLIRPGVEAPAAEELNGRRRRMPSVLSPFKFTKVMASPEVSLGALYMVDLYERAHSGGALNPAEALLVQEIRKEVPLPDSELLGALVSAVPDAHITALSRDPEAVPILNRVLGTRYPLAGTRDIAALSISEQAVGVVLLLNEGGGTEPPDKPEKFELPRTMGGALDAAMKAFGMVNAGIDTVNRFRKKKDTDKKPAAPPTGSTPPTETPGHPNKTFQEPGLIGAMLTEPGYRIALDQIICHEEQERWSRDDLYFVWETTVFLIDKSDALILTARGGSNQILKMNGRDESDRRADPYRAQHPSAQIGDHVYALEPKEAYMMFQYKGAVVPIPRRLFKKAIVSFAAYNEDLITGDTLKKITDLIAGAVVIGGIYKNGQAADFEKTAKATEKFIAAIKKFLNEDDGIVLHTFEVYKSDFEADFAPLNNKEEPLPTSAIPWTLRTGHRRIRDTEALGRGPIFHGYRNPFFNDTETSDFFRFTSRKGRALTDEELDQVEARKGRSALFKVNQAGGFWTEFRVRLEKTK